MSSEFAEPGDTDLCCDIDGTVITSVTLFGDNEMMVILEGGSGLMTEDGVPSHWDSIRRLELHFGYAEGDIDPELMRKLADLLEDWRVKATPLRLLSAHGRFTTLVQDRSTWIPIPCEVGT